MDNQETEFNKAAKTLKGVSLTTREKDAMRKHIYEATEVGEVVASTPSPFVYSSFFRQRTLVALMAVFLLTASTSYASFASLSSLPGEPLYDMKVNVLEPIGAAVRLNEKEKNQYRVTLLRQRVAEIKRLKEEDRLKSYNELISFKAAQKIIAEIEASLSFDAEAENLEIISTQVETYNSIVLDESFKLKTIIELHINEENPSQKSSTTTTEEVREIVDDNARNTKVPIQEVEEEVEVEVEVETTVEETTKPIEMVGTTTVKKVTPIKIPEILNIIGL
ncbi:MAG: hypothetical protein WD605_00540 [Candidatus Paceibacterota bacterium]